MGSEHGKVVEKLPLSRQRARAGRLGGILCIAVLSASIGGTQAQQQTPDLSTKSLEDLMGIDVSSVSTREEQLSRTAAAVFVITRRGIQQSGANNVPDLLRMAPGVDVAQINGDVWTISTRGLNDRFSNELLVLVDGRAVYTPTFGGVFWDSLDLPLEDIEQIEVIRGPGRQERKHGLDSRKTMSLRKVRVAVLKMS